MLIENYYTVLSRQHQEDADVFHVSMNADCAVYKGHFPGEPISPGVCNIQMIKECLEEVVGQRLLLDTIQQCRLTTLVTPIAYPELDVRIQVVKRDAERVSFKAQLGQGEESYLELKGEAAIG